MHTSPPSDAKSRDECQSFSVGVATFFINKVLNIRARIAVALVDVIPNPLMSDPSHVGSTLDGITLVRPDEFETILVSMSGKSSPLDFVPTSLLKKASGTFSHIIARLANLSFDQGDFPTRFKTAQITPLLKKLDSTIPIRLIIDRSRI